jgi:hypothetical protein
MALTTRQRNALPAAAFLDRAHRRFPAPTRAQARRAGISEAQRVRTLRNALARAGQSQPRRQAIGKGGRKVTVKNVTPTVARRAVRARGAGQVASVKRGRRTARRTATGTRRTRRR